MAPVVDSSASASKDGELELIDLESMTRDSFQYSMLEKMLKPFFECKSYIEVELMASGDLSSGQV